MYKLILPFITAISFFRCFSQEIQDIETDRPDQTECSSVIPHKSIQIETGVLYESDEENTLYFPTSLFRFGAFKKLEFRISAGEYYKSKLKTDSITCVYEGFSPVSFGAKIFIANGRKIVPQTSLIFHINRESKYFNQDIIPFDLRFSMSHTLLKQTDLGYNLGVEWNQNKKTFTFIYTLTVAFSISDKWGSYIESFGDLADKKLPVHQVDAGIIFLPKKNLQFDTSAGIALNKNSTNLYLSAGISMRIPK